MFDTMFSVRTYNTLKRANIESIDALMAMSDDEIKAIPRLSTRGFDEIKTALSSVEAPVSAPVSAPVEAPVSAPVSAPVEAPVSAPVEAPAIPAYSVPIGALNMFNFAFMDDKYTISTNGVISIKGINSKVWEATKLGLETAREYVRGINEGMKKCVDRISGVRDFGGCTYCTYTVKKDKERNCYYIESHGNYIPFRITDAVYNGCVWKVHQYIQNNDFHSIKLGNCNLTKKDSFNLALAITTWDKRNGVLKCTKGTLEAYLGCVLWHRDHHIDFALGVDKSMKKIRENENACLEDLFK